MKEKMVMSQSMKPIMDNEVPSEAPFFLKAILAAISGVSLPAMIIYLLM